jgi:hypothetical protein
VGGVVPVAVRSNTADPSARASRWELFEPRLALSANAAAGALLDTLEWDVASPWPPQAEAAEGDGCRPQPVLQPRGDISQMQMLGDESTGAVGELLSQAAEVRSRWQLTGAGQTVAVIDSGIAWDHIALGEGFGPGYRVVGGWDFAEGDADPYDDGPAGFHGTHVSGLLAADGAELVGVAPGADLVGLRVFDDAGASSLDWIESALQWVYEHRDTFESPITTVNLSLGAELSSAVLEGVHAQFADELANLAAAKIVVVAAAGNQFDSARPDALAFPAVLDSVWAAASHDVDGALSDFSQRTAGVLSAAGRDVISAVPDHVLGWDGDVDDYHGATGTSMAAPQLAGSAVLIREAMTVAGTDPTPETIRGVLEQTAAPRVDPITGWEYFAVDLVAAIDSVLAETDRSAPPESYDLGVLEWGSARLDGGTELQVTAARTGVFSLALEASAESLPLRITAADGQLLHSGPWAGEQLDLPVRGGDTLSIAIPASDATAELQLANLIARAGETLQLTTAADDPPVSIDLAHGLSVSVGMFDYEYSADDVSRAIVDGGGRADRLELRGSAASGRLSLNPQGESWLREGGVELVLQGFEEVQYHGAGGADRATLYDTPGADRLVARPGAAILEGSGFRYEVHEAARSFVHATAGGRDSAFLYDSAGDEQLAVRPQFVSLRGDDFFNLAFGFERVQAYGSAGGHDVAQLYDSAGDDRMSASRESALISGAGYYVQAKFFTEVTAWATAGGDDLATLYGEAAGTGRWIRTDDQLTLRGAGGAARTARGFETALAFEAGTAIDAPDAGGVTPTFTTLAVSTPAIGEPSAATAARVAAPGNVAADNASPQRSWIGLDSSDADVEAERWAALLSGEQQRSRKFLEMLLAERADEGTPF